MNTQFDAVQTSLLRDLIVNSLSDEELIVFCYDHFIEVYNNFPLGIGRVLKVHMLIEHCQRHGRIEELLELIKTANPYQYGLYLQRKRSTVALVALDGSNQHSAISKILSLTITGDFSNLSEEQLEWIIVVLKAALAAATNSSPEEFQVMEIKSGSLKLDIRLPADMADHLLEMHKSDSILLRGLGIERVSEVPLGAGNIADREIQDALTDLNKELDSLLHEGPPSSVETLRILVERQAESLENAQARSELVVKIAHLLGVSVAGLSIISPQETKYINGLVEQTKDYLKSRIETIELIPEELEAIRSVITAVRSGEEKIHKWPWPLSLGIGKK